MRFAHLLLLLALAATAVSGKRTMHFACHGGNKARGTRAPA